MGWNMGSCAVVEGVFQHCFDALGSWRVEPEREWEYRWVVEERYCVVVAASSSLWHCPVESKTW